MAVLAMLLSLFGLEANFCSPPGLPRNRANRISRSPTSASVIDVAGRCNAANVRNPPFVPEPLAVTAMELLAALNRQS